MKNIVLDIGNVICRWDPQGLSAGVSESPEEQAELISVTIGHSDWLELDKGTMPLNEAIANAQQRSTINPDKIAALYHTMPASLTLIETTVTGMHKAVAAGVPLYVLSNMHKHSWAHLESTYDVFSLCKGIVVSCNIALAKPDAAIYNHLCERFSLQAQDCVFIDDMLENVEAAKACGWHGAQLTDTSKGGELIENLLSQM